MENNNPEKEWLKDHQILPRISFEPDKPRTFKIVQRKRESFTNTKDELVDGIKYKVLEGKEVKTFFTASQGLIGKLAEIKDDTMVKITQKKVRSAGQIRTSYEVAVVSEEGETIIEENEIPVINEEENTEGEEPPF